MAYKIVIEPTAERDLQEILEWYYRKEKYLLFKFLTKFDEAIKQLSSNPEQFQKRYGETRIVFTHPYPYGIHYILKENFIHILAVLHTKRRLG